MLICINKLNILLIGEFFLQFFLYFLLKAFHLKITFILRGQSYCNRAHSRISSACENSLRCVREKEKTRVRSCV